MKHILFLFSLLFSVYSSAQILDTNIWSPDGKVNSILKQGSKLYIGGKFSYVGPSTGGFVTLSLPGNTLNKFPQVDGLINDIIADGNGGWYFCGNFLNVNGNPLHRYLAHCFQDGSLDTSFHHSLAYSGTALAISSDSVYVSYEYSYMSQFHSNIYIGSKVNGRGSSYLKFAFDISGTIGDLEIINNTLYIGGTFSSPKSNFFSLDLSNRNITSFNPTVNGSVTNLSSFGNNLYIGGQFTNINGLSRSNLACLDLNTLVISSWNPGANNYITAIEAVGGVVYVGGFFTTLGGSTRNYLGAVDAATGGVLPWAPAINSYVNDIAVSSTDVYVTGGFITSGATSRSYFASFSSANGNLNSLDLNPNNIAYALCLSNNILSIGGNIKSVFGAKRNNLACIDLLSGKATGWNPNVNDEVKSIAFNSDKIYAGGYFTNAGGQVRNRLASFDTLTGLVTLWNPNLNNYVNSILVKDSLLYSGGNFTTVGGQPKSYLAAFNLNNGVLNSWNVTLNAFVKTMAIPDSVLYIGGLFTSVNSQTRNYLASINIKTAALLPWNPNPNNVVDAISINKDKIWISGYFTGVSGKLRNRVALIDKGTGKLNLWNYPSFNCYGEVNSIASLDNMVIYEACYDNYNFIFAIDPFLGNIIWKIPVRTAYSSYCIYVAENTLFIGGDYSILNNTYHPSLSVFRNLSYTNHISGKIFQDNNLDCELDNGEKKLKNYFIKATNANTSFYSSTDSSGNYSMAVPTGNYTVQQFVPSRLNDLISQICPANGGDYNLSLGAAYQDSSHIDFADSVKNCSFLNLDIMNGRSRLCSRTTTSVAVCNEGNSVASNVILNVEMGEGIIPLSANYPWVITSDSSLQFNIGSVDPFECNSVIIVDSVTCNLAFDKRTVCTKARLSTPNQCLPINSNWDQSEIKVTGWCENSLTRFRISNNGVGDMTDSSSFRIFFNDTLIYVGKFKLLSGADLIVNYPPDGNTIRCEADQRPFYPRKSKPRATIEACGNQIRWTPGFIDNVSQDDFDEDVEYYCSMLRYSFDPNHKTVAPSGVSSHHYIKSNDDLEYVIAFQNTGSDTAYRVAIVDTLDLNLDLTSLTVGASSHNYNFFISGSDKPVLNWIFEGIKLPDSLSGKSSSQGFVKYRISQKQGNPKGTIIKNTASIFFDYNVPVVTNTTQTIVWDTVFYDNVKGSAVTLGNIITGASPKSAYNSFIKVNPNPFINTTRIAMASPGLYKIYVYDVIGRMVLSDQFKGEEYNLQNIEAAGLYIVKIEGDTGNFLVRIIKY